MASCPITCCNIVNHRHHNHNHNRPPPPPPPLYSCTSETTRSTTFRLPFYSYTFKLNRRNSFPSTLSSGSGCCRATDLKSEPPPEKHMSPVSGVTESFTRFQDTLRIFFAVLFWMSLFFWSSIWDGGNDGQPNKQSRFRK